MIRSLGDEKVRFIIAGVVGNVSHKNSKCFLYRVIAMVPKYYHFDVSAIAPCDRVINELEIDHLLY